MKIVLCAVVILMLQFNVFAQEGIYSFDSTQIRNDTVFNVFPDYLQAAGSTDTTGISGNWSKDYTIPGISGTIYATATDGTNLYVGGRFRIAGNVIANNIAKWDGQAWTSIGEGPENGVYGYVPTVHALAFADGKLFAGGQFSRAGTVDVNGIAYWDGNAWNSMGADSTNGVRRIVTVDSDTLILQGFIWSLFAHGDKIYAGGWYQLAGKDTTNGIAAWDLENERWESLDGGFSSTDEDEPVTAYAFTADSSIIYMGGQFTYAGGIPAKNIAAWDGQNWLPVGGDFSYNIRQLSLDRDGNLFAVIQGNPDIDAGASGIWKFSDNIWVPIAGPVDYQTSVFCMEILNDTIYAGGTFWKDEFGASFAFGMYDGDTWHKIDGLGITRNHLLEAHIQKIQLVNDRMYLAGGFTEAGILHPVNVVEWDYISSKWKLLHDGLANRGIHDGYIHVLEQSGDTIYAGGAFTIAGGIEARNIAMFTNESWHSVGNADSNGINGTVYTLFIEGKNVYAGGSFNRAGPEATFHVARWNGKKWFPIGIGVGGVPGAHVKAVVKTGDYLYVAGYFSVVGDIENYELPANSIARYNLITERWETIGRGIEYVYGIPGTVYDMELHKDRIYVAGDFQSADDKFYKNFALLEGNKWAGMDGTDSIGINGTVKVVKVINDEIYIGGLLYSQHDGQSSGILKWNGNQWVNVAQPLIGENVFVNDIVAYDSGFFAGGLFGTADNPEINNLAWFDGNSWNPVGGGIFPGVSNLAVHDKSLFAAGPAEILTNEGLSMGIAVFDFKLPVTDTIIKDTVIVDTTITNIGIQDVHITTGNYPNPFSDFTTIYFSIEVQGHLRIQIYDQQGRVVRTLLDEYRQPGNHNVEFKRGNLIPGVYFYRIRCNEFHATGKLLIK